MNLRDDARRAAPWALCAVSLSLLAVSSAMRWALRNDSGVGYEEWLEGTLAAFGVAGIPVVGALIASRLPANPYGWVWCGVGLAYGASEVPPLVRAAGGPHWVAWVLEGWGFLSFLGLMVFVFLLFPTGRPPTRRWRWVGRGAVTSVLVAVAVIPFTFDPADPAAATPWAAHGPAGRYLLRALLAGVVAAFAFLLAAMASLALRFRRAGAVERRQLTWFLYATVLLASYLALGAVGVLPSGWIDAALNAASLAVLPVAVGVAMLRYRLFDIDRIVSRTVSYGLLSAALIGLYLLVVALLRPLLEPLTGSSALAVAGSTLAVAAVFNPARRRLQAVVDRRFDRARYDAGRAVDAFTARLRNQVDLDEVTTGLRDTVMGTVAPTSIGVWLTGPTGLPKG